MVLAFSSSLAADNLEKTQKKELESQVKTMTAEAQKLEKAGQLAEARIKYAESQALIEMKDVTDAIKHLDDEIHKRVKDALGESRKLYESHKFKEAATALDANMKLQAFQSVLAYDLALCYYQIGDRNQALEYLGKARAGTNDPKQKQRLAQLNTYFITGERAASLKDSDKDRIDKVNRLSESIGVDAFLEDAEGSEEPSNEVRSSSAQSGSQAPARTNSLANAHGNTSATRRSSLCDALSEVKVVLASSPSETFQSRQLR